MSSSLEEDQKQVIDLVPGQGRVELKKIEKALGKKKAAAIVSQLVRQGLVKPELRTGAGQGKAEKRTLHKS